MSKPTHPSDQRWNNKYVNTIVLFFAGLNENRNICFVLGGAVLFLFLLIRPQMAMDYQGLEVNEPAPRTVYAPFAFEFVDESATDAKKKEAVQKLNPVYNHQPDRLEALLSNLEILQQTVHSVDRKEGQSIQEWGEEINSQVPFSLPNHNYDIENFDIANVDIANVDSESNRTTFYELLFQYRDDNTLWLSLRETIQTAIGEGITNEISPLRNAQVSSSGTKNNEPGVIQIIDPNGEERVSFSGQEIFTFEQFLTRLLLQMKNGSSDETKSHLLPHFAEDLVQAVYAGPTLTYNQELTERRKQERLERVTPVIVRISEGEIIVGYQEEITPRQMIIIEEIAQRMTISTPAEFGYLLLSIFFVLMVSGYCYYFYPVNSFTERSFLVIFFTIFLTMFLAKVSAYLSLVDIGSYRFQFAEYGVPVGALGVVLTVLYDSRFAIYICSITAIYCGFIFSGQMNNVPILNVVVAAATAWCAIFSIHKIRQRTDLYRAGGVVIVVGSILIFTHTLFHAEQFQTFGAAVESLKWSLLWSAVNGCLVAILSVALLPVLEELLGITTDIKLLELSQRNALLKKLEEDAPGSYQHTMRVATLAESAAEAIGANTLLTRVGAYYHDIGKTVKPQYFVENQHTKADRAKHSKISTNMSCMIIRNHVKHGLEIAKQYNLPIVIQDFIPEHHGTTLMTYFYHEALAEQEKEGTVKEKDFRYPGPKPQSKETAILMLSDALEATSRTLENVSEREIRQLVRKIINDRFMDGQFDECNLTLQDLHTLYQSFSESLLHTMHQRIVYPEKPTSDKQPLSSNPSAKQAAQQSPAPPSAADSNEHNEEEDKPVAIKQK